MKGLKRIERKRVLQAFEQYVSEYNIKDPKIKLKIDHTYRVADIAKMIAKEARVDEELAWLSGMLHDIGRFEQVRRYNTFSDAISIDHATLGADLLFRDGLIEEYDLNLSRTELAILEHSIRYHSAYRLPNGLSECESRYCNVLRDADKIDIFRVNCDTPFEDIYNVTTDELKASEVSEEIKRCFISKKAVLKEWKKTPADYVSSLVCLVFELVYPVSLSIAHQQGYVDRLLDFKSENSETSCWFDYMREHVWE